MDPYRAPRGEQAIPEDSDRSASIAFAAVLVVLVWGLVYLLVQARII